MKEGRSDGANGFLFLKKADGEGARDVVCAFALDLGLEATLGLPTGVKELAFGLGLNSSAFTLNLVEMADVGVWVLLRFCGLEIPEVLIAGPVGGARFSWIGKGVGTDTGAPSCFCLCMSAKRWPKRPVPVRGETTGTFWAWNDLSILPV